jgi:hypothetical protein
MTGPLALLTAALLATGAPRPDTSYFQQGVDYRIRARQDQEIGRAFSWCMLACMWNGI